MRLALIIEYEGTRYQGFQLQLNAPSIQGELEEAIEKLTAEKIRLRGAGRTDAGVHALGQVVAFDTHSHYTIDTFVKALNYYLPEDIAVKQAHLVRDDFDPRRDAVSRAYRYSILNSPTPSPLLARFALHVGRTLDTEAMQKAATYLEGEHDFSMFSRPLQGIRSTRRRIYKAQVWRKKDRVIIDVEGNSFLPQQVRRMTGALVQAGLGKMSLGQFQELLAYGENARSPAALPAKGLCLIGVHYKDFPPKVGKENDDDQ
ncbi:MAG: tRNA pseudouridine(38-40) synthase TruA [Chloroflexi bacterium]|nr:tRNA pseudouridine(38-40) synthase TruA [Chloroflexota bacterium]